MGIFCNVCSYKPRDDHEAVTGGPVGKMGKNVFVPKNVWDDETTMKKTENYDKIMGRTWYLIANSMGADGSEKA